MLAGVRDWSSRERVLVFLLLVSLGIKVAILLSGEIINRDGVRYISAAQQFAEGNFLEGLRIEKMPFYPMLIGFFRLLVGDWELSARLISLVATVSATIPLYLLTRDLFGKNAAFWAGLAFALSPALNEISLEVIRDPLFLFFVAWAVYFFWRGLSACRAFFFLLTSTSSIFALLSRIEGVVLFPLFLSILLVLAIKNSPDRPLLLKGIALIVGLPLVLGLLTSGCLMMWADRELFTVSRLGEPLAYLQSLFNGDFFDMYRHIYAHLKAYKNPTYVWDAGSFANTARHYLFVIYLISVTEAVARNLFLLFVFPLLAGFRKLDKLHRGHWLILLLAGAYFWVGYYYLFSHDFLAKRYVLVPSLLLFPWVGRGLDRIWTGISNCRRPTIAMAFFLLVFCAAPALKSLEALIEPGNRGGIRDAGQWLSMQPQFRNAVVACADPRVRFYSSGNLKFSKEMENAYVARDFRAMERMALEIEADLLVVEISKKKRRHLTVFKDFYLLKEFVGNVDDVLIYCRKG
jgi:4-amino-4-deoxy-L-arabinose transferase-like glycosyltransferase